MSMLQSDLNLRALLGEIGLDDLLRWETTRTGFYVDGKLYSMSSSLDFLRFPPLSLVDKGRLAATILLASRIKDWRRLEAGPGHRLASPWSGRRTFDRIWLPLLKSKLGDNYRLGQRGVHLGDHRPHVRGPSLGTQARIVRVRRGWVRHGAPAVLGAARAKAASRSHAVRRWRR